MGPMGPGLRCLALTTARSVGAVRRKEGGQLIRRRSPSPVYKIRETGIGSDGHIIEIRIEFLDCFCGFSKFILLA